MSIRTRLFTFILSASAVLPTAALAQDPPYTVEPLKEAPPEGLAGPIRDQLQAEGVRVLDGEGNPFVEFWLRREVPVSSPHSGAKGAILYPEIQEGEFIGAVRFPGEWYDYRDQVVNPGAYTIRYGLQPVNGDHLGVSTYRDYVLLLVGGQDKEPAPIAQMPLEDRSAEAAGSNHPAVMMLLPAPDGSAADGAEVVEDAANDRWGVALPVPLKAEGSEGTETLPIQFVIYGYAAV